VSEQNRAFLWYRLAILSSTISNIHCSDDTYIASNLTSSIKDNSIKVTSHCRQYNIGNIALINYYGNIMATAWILNLLRALVGKLLSKIVIFWRYQFANKCRLNRYNSDSNHAWFASNNADTLLSVWLWINLCKSMCYIRINKNKIRQNQIIINILGKMHIKVEIIHK